MKTLFKKAEATLVITIASIIIPPLITIWLDNETDGAITAFVYMDMNDTKQDCRKVYPKIITE